MTKSLAVAALATLAFAMPAPGASAQTAAAPAPFQALVALPLINGWTNAPFGTSAAMVQIANSIVRFKGAIATAGANPTPFIMPLGYRPATNVYVPVDLCNATNGRLFIQPNGVVTVQAETSFSNAQCFTSLDGASFARNAVGFTPLALVNGWVNAPFATSASAFENNAGILQLKGAIAGGTASQAFTLPAAVRPVTNVYVPIDLCNATNGRLFIQPSGIVSVQAEKSFSNAKCFTSLDGASFVHNTAGFTPLVLINGWVNAPFSTGLAAFRNISGVVQFKGAIATTKANPTPFVLPASVRPTKNVYVQVDLCNATNGRLFIQPNGIVTVQAETLFSNAQCFTSLEGTSFVR
jgi:hypothetical protein